MEKQASSNKIVRLLRTCWRYDVTTTMGRRLQTLKIISVSMIAVLGLLVFVIEDVHEASTNIHTASNMEQSLASILQVAELIHRLQIERGLTVLCIGSRGNDDQEKVIASLNVARQTVDDTLTNIEWPFGTYTEALSEYFHNPEKFQAHLDTHRHRVGKTCQHGNSHDQIEFYTVPINKMLGWFFHTIKQSADGKVIVDFIGYYMLIAGKDRIGIERALGGSFFSTGHFADIDQLIWYANHSFLGREYLETSTELMPDLTKAFERETNNTVMNLIDKKRDVIFQNKPNNASVSAGQNWFDLMTKYLDALFQVQQSAGKSLIERLDSIKVNSKENLAKRLSFLILTFLLIPFLVFSVHRMTGSIQDYTFKLAQTTLELQEEKQRADTLLHQMFPHSVAEMLKKKEQIEPEFFSSVTIFFSDIVNFTEMCSVMTPLQVTAMLDTVYGMFDDRISHYDAYKVETIGDAYMVVSGLPQKNGIKHADQIARMSLDFIEVVEGLSLSQFPSGRVLVRIGIHTGPCVAGVVGKKMPRYCLFGDTVNTASRMQSTGEPQKIHISAHTKEVLDEIGGYRTVFRSSVAVKGKGNMSTYWLQGIMEERFGSAGPMSWIQ